MNHDLLKSVRLEVRQNYTARDTILYALGVGAGATDPIDPRELSFTYEVGLQALPTMAVVLGLPGFWLSDPQYDVNWQRLLAGEQSTLLHQPLPIEGSVVGVTTVDEIYDKGANKGAVIYWSRNIFDEAEGNLLATVSGASFLRGDGGFGGKSEGAPRPHAIPSGRIADQTIELSTRPEQALIYRLSGDSNPVHVDPAIAKMAGFERPILHGLCTYGFAGRGLLTALCAANPQSLKRMDVRYSSPVYPGETIILEIWHETPGAAAFRARVKERNVVVLQNGYAEYAI